DQRSARVGDHTQAAHRGHRAVRVGVDAGDLLRLAQTAGVLNRAGHAERHVPPGRDGHPGRADLPLRIRPPRLGRDPRPPPPRADGARPAPPRSRGRTPAGGPPGRGPPRSPAPPPNTSGASARSIAAASGGATESTSASPDRTPPASSGRSSRTGPPGLTGGG